MGPMGRPKSSLGITRVPFLLLKGVIGEPEPPKRELGLSLGPRRQIPK